MEKKEKPIDVTGAYEEGCFTASAQMELPVGFDGRDFVLQASRRQIEVISAMCDNYSRIICGQFEAGLMPLVKKAIRRHSPGLGSIAREELFREARQLLDRLKVLAWGLDCGAGYGVGYDDDADIIYDIHQVLRHFLWQTEPEPKQHYGNAASEPLKFGSEPLIRSVRGIAGQDGQEG